MPTHAKTQRGSLLEEPEASGSSGLMDHLANTTGMVFNIQKFSVQDGPGIRTTVFLKGCPLNCSWCHNPEGLSPQREIAMSDSRCLVCGRCREACDYASHISGEGPLPIRHEWCILCGECAEACPTEARQILGREMSVNEVVNEVVQDRIFYDDSSGGVTFSGGEPLMQPLFLRRLLEACRSRGLHTAVDTCGFACTADLLAIAPLTDLFLYDLKLMDEEEHRRQTGVSNEPILQNLKVLDQIHNQIWVRIPLIPGVTDTMKNLQAVARFAASFRGVRQVNLLPYHKTGLQKHRRLGHGDNVASWDADTQPPEGTEAALDYFRTYDLSAKVGG